MCEEQNGSDCGIQNGNRASTDSDRLLLTHPQLPPVVEYS